MMMDDSAPILERRKTYKNVLPQKRTVVVVLKYKKDVMKWSRKTTTDVINPAN